MLAAGAARRIRICTRGWRRRSRLRRCPQSAELSQALYRESQKPDNYSDRWLSRAFYIAALRHRTTFSTAYKADAAALPFDSLPIALRLGALKPDWRLPAAADVATDWKDMQVPGNWEIARAARLRRRRVVHADGRLPRRR